MIHIVSGLPRTGTSMMMRALEAGGMSVRYSGERETLSRARSDEFYQMNPDHRLYEITSKEVGVEATYSGGVVKVIAPWMRFVPKLTDSILVIYMRRNPEEIRQSQEAAGVNRNRFTTDQLAKMQERFGDDWTRRASVLGIEYSDVVDDPAKVFERIAETWPIDPVRAASVVDPGCYRFRLGLLTVGI